MRTAARRSHSRVLYWNSSNKTDLGDAVLCYENAKIENTVPAVAFCTSCGAGVCAAHVREGVMANVTTNAVGAPTVGPDRRVLRCLACH